MYDKEYAGTNYHKVKHLLSTTNLNQREIAKNIGCHPNTVYRIVKSLKERSSILNEVIASNVDKWCKEAEEKNEEEVTSNPEIKTLLEQLIERLTSVVDKLERLDITMRAVLLARSRDSLKMEIRNLRKEITK